MSPPPPVSPRQAEGEALGRKLIAEGWTGWMGIPLDQATAFQATFNALQLVLAGSEDELKAVEALGAVFGCIVRDGLTPGAEKAFMRGFAAGRSPDVPTSH